MGGWAKTNLLVMPPTQRQETGPFSSDEFHHSVPQWWTDNLVEPFGRRGGQAKMYSGERKYEAINRMRVARGTTRFRAIRYPRKWG